LSLKKSKSGIILYTRKMRGLQSGVYHAVLFAIFLPMVAVITTGDAVALFVLVPLFLATVAVGVVYRIRSYCELTTHGLLIMPTKELIHYSTIVGIMEYGRSELEIDYMWGEERRIAKLSFTFREHLVWELHKRMKG